MEIKLDILCEEEEEEIVFDQLFSSLSILVKPIIRLFLNEKEIPGKNLTIIENTFELVRCQISANPSIVPEIQWLKNEQLILGEINIDRLS